MSIYTTYAHAFWEKGYSPIPVNPKNKAPLAEKWDRFSDESMTEDEVKAYQSQYPNASIGLVMGTVVEDGWKIIAIDIDDNDLTEACQFALGPTPSAKRGAKGLTLFARIHVTTNAGTKRFVRKSEGKKINKPSVEILGAKSQTVIPPSVHPDTKKAYEWIGKSLLDINFSSLPIATNSLFDELDGICQGTIEHITALNTMTWLGVGKGGDTDDTCTKAAASMVRRGWTDDEAFARLKRAKIEACHRNGDEYNWAEADERKTIMGWINGARAKGFDKAGEEARSKKASAKRILERDMQKWAIEYYGGVERIVSCKGQIRLYKEGHWSELPEAAIGKLLITTFDEAKSYDIHAAIKNIHLQLDRPEFGAVSDVNAENDPKMSRVCLLNGTLDLTTGKLGRHCAEDELLHQLKFDWDDEAECPVYEKFINEMFKGNQEVIDCVEEFIAHTLVPNNSYQKALVLQGRGGNGKGALMRLWTKFFHPSVVATVDVSQLGNDRMLASLAGKLISFSTESSKLDKISDAAFKKITGNDPISFRMLYREVQNNEKFFVRFVMLCNDMPSTTDDSLALQRRLIIIPCPNVVTAEQFDHSLENNMAKELCGILRKRLIPALHRLYRQGHFSEPASSKEAAKKYVKQNESVLYWLQECCIFPEKDTDLDTWTTWSTSKELYDHYSAFAKRKGFNYIVNEIQWSGKLNEYNCASVTRHSTILKKPAKMRPIGYNDETDY